MAIWGLLRPVTIQSPTGDRQVIADPVIRAVQVIKIGRQATNLKIWKSGGCLLDVLRIILYWDVGFTVGIHRSIFETPKFPKQNLFKTHTSLTATSLNKCLLPLCLIHSYYQTAKLTQLLSNCQFNTIVKSNLFPIPYAEILRD